MAFNNYLAYIDKKEWRTDLSLVDLLHASNFKGGFSSIASKEAEISGSLQSYSKILRKIDEKLGAKPLRRLNSAELDWFQKQASEFCTLPTRKETKIQGFGPAYASAVLAAHFPTLAPVIDRNVLVGSGVVKVTSLVSGQVKTPETYYSQLIGKLHHRLVSDKSNRSLRNLDQVLFSRGQELIAKERERKKAAKKRMANLDQA